MSTRRPSRVSATGTPDLPEAPGYDSAGDRIGPWVKVRPHEYIASAWHCVHRSSGQEAVVELHREVDADALESEIRRGRLALRANPSLLPFGAERLFDVGRVLPPPSGRRPASAGPYRYLIAREAPDDGPRPRSVSRAELRLAAELLLKLVEASRVHGIDLDLSQRSLSLLPRARLVLQRPGLTEPLPYDIEEVALDFLEQQPLAQEDLQTVVQSRSLEDLIDRLAGVSPKPLVPAVAEAADPEPALPPPVFVPQPAPVRTEVFLRRPADATARPPSVDGAGIPAPVAPPAPFEPPSREPEEVTPLAAAAVESTPGPFDELLKDEPPLETTPNEPRPLPSYPPMPKLRTRRSWLKAPLALAGVAACAFALFVGAVVLEVRDPESGAVAAPEVTPTAEAAPAEAPIAVEEPPPPPPPPNRENCAEITGTDYQSDAERDWFLLNCT